jgi:transposase-like protein
MSAPTAYTAEIADRILDALMDGRTLIEVCNEAGMPATSTVRQWVAEDREGFGARYHRIREIGRSPERATLYTDEIAQRILDQLESGRSLADVCSDDGMPSAGTVRNWAMDDREGFTARYRRARDIGRGKAGRFVLYTPELAERILAELKEGRSLRDVCRDDGMPSASTVIEWEVTNRDGFAARYQQARDIGYRLAGEELDEIAADGRNDWVERRTKDGGTERVLDREHISRSRLRVEHGQWNLVRMLPKTYGSRVEVTATHEHTADRALAAVMKAIDSYGRGLPSTDPPPVQLLTLEDDSHEPD